MFAPLLSFLLLTTPVSSSSQGLAEPDGSHVVGVVPPFHGEPAPPEWLRRLSHAAADPDCRHYVYEAYASDRHWMTRYVMLPEGDEAFRDIEQVFLFPRPGDAPKPTQIAPAQVSFEPSAAHWKGEAFRLVDRRELMKP
ncbi:MAG TPA: hypothetical protein VF768_09990 [Holophagaceae bacterium]